MATVLVGFGEALPAPEVVFSLQRAGHQVTAFYRKGSRPALRRLLSSEPVAICPPEEDVARAIADLRAAVDRLEGGLIFPLDDIGLWLVNEAFGDSGERPLIVGATQAQAAFALDKLVQIEAAGHAGLQPPLTTVAHTLDDIHATMVFPSIVKPAPVVTVADGRIARKSAHFLQSPEDARRLSASDLTFPSLVQPLVSGVGEGVFGFATDAGVVQWSGHRRLRMMNPHGSGASACAVNPPEPELCDQVAAMIRSIGWRGPFMVELLRDASGTSWFMEVNGRMWGSMALARRSGFEYPAWAVAQALDPNFVPEREPVRSAPVTVRHLGRELLHLLHVLRGPKTDFHASGWPRLWPTLQAVLAPGPKAGFYNFDPSRPTYFLQDAVDVVASAIRGRR